MVLSELQPKSVFEFFENLTQIPRASGNEKAVSDFLVAFAKERGLEVKQDGANNVIIKKPATPGYEDAPTVIIQGHMDMVCEKNGDTEFDFDKDPLNIKIDGEYITAEGTTLGADNGIAVAYAMAVLDDKSLQHPALEVVITTDEETGMTGADFIDASDLKGKYFINVDSESEGTFIVGCAGGTKVTLPVPISREEVTGTVMHIGVRGLKGGHSGEDINKNRGNANKLMNRLVRRLQEEVSLQFVSITGGAKDNAIPREADVKMVIDEKDIDQVKAIVADFEKVLQEEHATSEPSLSLECSVLGSETVKAMTLDSTKAVMNCLTLLPCGVQTMSAEIEGLVESSLNVGVVVTEEEEVKFILALRSSKKTRLDDIVSRLRVIASVLDSELIIRGAYPAWEFKRESPLRDIFMDTYRKKYDKEPGIRAIHAGLECGLFSEKMPGVDIISLGPDMEDIHTPDERLHIASAARVYEFLAEALAAIK